MKLQKLTRDKKDQKMFKKAQEVVFKFVLI